MLKLIYHYTIEVLALLVVIIQSYPILIKTWLQSINVWPLKCKSIKNQIILITGGGNGLGRGMAIEFAKYENQCTIVIADIDFGAAQNTVDYLKKNFNVNAYAYHCDVGEYESVVKLYQSVLKDVGYVDILVNNAGLITFISLREKEWTDLERIIKVNLHSHVWMTRVFLDDMIRRKSGHIVAISSIAGHFSCPSMITYCATKHGVTGLMKCLANELYAEGHSDYLKTTLVCPYFIDTRRELVDYLSLPVPPFKTSAVASEVVQGILNEKDEVYVPKALSLFKFFTLVPFKVYNKIIYHFHKTARTEKYQVSY